MVSSNTSLHSLILDFVCVLGKLRICLGRGPGDVGGTSLSVRCRFVAKVRSLDPSYSNVVPWQPRGYKRKRGREGGPAIMTEETNGPEVKKLFSPLLDQEEQVSGEPQY